MLKERFEQLVQALVSEIKCVYQGRLVSVVVFGSVGRGTQRFDSDVDILVVAENLPRGRIRRIEEFEEVERKVEPQLEALREEGIHSRVSAIIKNPQEAEAGSPLFLDMVEDARILYDREGFFGSRLDRLKKRLDELGAKRVRRGNAWYWDLKPDYRPGEIIEL
ncbi:MAG: nucleotidyltransferase domain-containing protein [Spirochaetota bacterium]